MLAERSKVSRKTILRGENGIGCTLTIENKLAHALRVGEGLLWVPQGTSSEHIHRYIGDRWFFCIPEEFNHYNTRYHLDEDSLDPDSIQSESERLRLGRNGLSSGFLR